MIKLGGYYSWKFHVTPKLSVFRVVKIDNSVATIAYNAETIHTWPVVYIKHYCVVVENPECLIEIKRGG